MPRWQPTREQYAWLMPRLSEYRQLPITKEKAFYARLGDDWLKEWPERDVLWPDLEELPLTKDQECELMSAEKQRYQVSHIDIYYWQWSDIFQTTDVKTMDFLGVAVSTTRS